METNLFKQRKQNIHFLVTLPLSWPGGSVYEGHWENGIRHGSGEMRWPNVLCLPICFLNTFPCPTFCCYLQGESYDGEWNGDQHELLEQVMPWDGFFLLDSNIRTARVKDFLEQQRAVEAAAAPLTPSRTPSERLPATAEDRNTPNATPNASEKNRVESEDEEGEEEEEETPRSSSRRRASPRLKSLRKRRSSSAVSDKKKPAKKSRRSTG